MARAARPDKKNIQLNPGAPSVRVCRGYAPPDYSLPLKDSPRQSGYRS